MPACHTAQPPSLLAEIITLFAPPRSSSALYERRQRTNPLNQLKFRCKRRTWNRYINHLETPALGVPNGFPPISISFSRSAVNGQCFTY